MRTWIWLPIIGLLALVGGGALLAQPLALQMAESRAEERGLELSVGDFSLGWMSATLRDTDVRLQGVESVRVHLREVEVDLGFTAPRLRAVSVRGGRVQIDGSLDLVKSELRAFSKRTVSQTSTSPSKGPRRVDHVRDVDIIWNNAWGNGDQQSIQGLNVDRGPQGQKLGADLVSLDLGAIELEVAGASLEAASGSLSLDNLTQARAAEARITYRSATHPRDSIMNHPPQGGGAQPAVVQEKQRESGLSRLLQPDEQRVARVVAAFDIYRNQLLPRLPPQVEIGRLWVTYRRNEEKLHVGPSKLLAKHDSSGLSVSVSPQGRSNGTPLSLILSLPTNSDALLARMELEGGPVALSTLGIQEGSFGLTGVRQTSIQGKMRATLDREAKHLSSEGQATVEGLSIDHRKLSPQLVLFPKLFASGKAVVKVDGSSYEVSGAEFSLGQARMQGDFALNKGDDFVTLRANLDAPLVSCQALVESAPRGLLGLVEQMEFRGTFSLKAGVDADTRDLRNMRVRWDFQNDCHAKAVPRALDPDQFRGLFRREVLGSGNFPMEVEFGPHSLNWTPYEEISPYVETAILVSEDGRFYRHDGFDDRAIESAIAQNTRAGRFVRGASTVSMQLAKNLYLSRDKTLSRKLQEAALTALLEQSFDKRELLELYMNIVEFGPSVYGISQAATHYFNCSPRELTAAQSFFLVSLLPSPTVNYFEEDGTLKEERAKYVRHLLSVAHQRGRLSESELEYANEEELHFGQKSTHPEGTEGPGLDPEEALPENDPLLSVPSPAALRPLPQRAESVKKKSGTESSSDDRNDRKPPPQQRAPSPPPPVDPRRRGIHL